MKFMPGVSCRVLARSCDSTNLEGPVLSPRRRSTLKLRVPRLGVTAHEMLPHTMSHSAQAVIVYNNLFHRPRFYLCMAEIGPKKHVRPHFIPAAAPNSDGAQQGSGAVQRIGGRLLLGHVRLGCGDPDLHGDPRGWLLPQASLPTFFLPSRAVMCLDRSSQIFVLGRTCR